MVLNSLLSQKKEELKFMNAWLILMRCLGIQLDPTIQSSSKCVAFFYRFVSFVWFMANVFSNIYCTTVFLLPLASNSRDGHSTGEMLSQVIDSVSFNLIVIVSHAVLLSLCCQSKWRQMWRNLKEMAPKSIDDGHRYRKYRQTVIFGIAFFVAVSNYVESNSIDL